MKFHSSMITSLKNIANLRKIKDDDDVSAWLLDDNEWENIDELKLFKNQQTIMDFAVHSADISQQCRPFDVVKEWVYLLFEEFFQQGDIEKEMGLPITMLCDRTTVKVSGTQNGFITHVVMPLFDTLQPFLPQLSKPGDCIEMLKSNA